jgi:membrane-associated protease RseP (regulator of RpoE activity)
LGQLVLIIAVAVALAMATGSFPTLVVVAAIVLMIMLHELGHFLVAKASGMKVTEYFLGFGPRLWAVRKGETEYGVKALPLGGYVRIVGMNNLETVDPADEARSYRAQSFPKRLAVVLAGSAMHFLIAFFLLVVVWSAIGIPNYDKPEPVVGSISKIKGGPSPAQAGGLRVGDRVVAVDHQPIVEWEKLHDYIRAHPGTPMLFSVNRHGRQVDLTIVPADINPKGEKVGFIGMSAAVPRERVAIPTAFSRSAHSFGDDVVLTVKGLASFFSPGQLKNYSSQLMRSQPPKGAQNPNDVRFLSPVDLVTLSGQAAESGVFAVLVFLIGLNIGVGVFNMVPLLPLDGGHAAIAVYERIRSRRGRPYRADVAKLLPVTFAVVGVLVVIVVSSLWLSFTNPMANPFQ